ncbi:MAG: hypothetical protein PHQ27_00030 [Victivallales bacterium]|nr:hypothetical protein [Victivallales bacterium]
MKTLVKLLLLGVMFVVGVAAAILLFPALVIILLLLPGSRRNVRFYRFGRNSRPQPRSESYRPEENNTDTPEIIDVEAQEIPPEQISIMPPEEQHH